MPILVHNNHPALLLVPAVPGPKPTLLHVPRDRLRQDGLQPLPLHLRHDEPVAEEQRPRPGVPGVFEQHLGVHEEEAVGVDEDDLPEAGQQNCEGLGRPAGHLPPHGVDHDPEVARHDALEVLEVLPRVAVQVAVADVHDLDGQAAPEPAEDGDLRQEVGHLVVARRQHDAPAALLEVRAERHVVGEVRRRVGEQELTEPDEQLAEPFVRVQLLG